MANRTKQVYFTTPWRTIPETNDKYVLGFEIINGKKSPVIASSENLFDSSTWQKASDSKTFKLSIFNKQVEVDAGWLVLFTYRPLFESKEFAFKLKAGFDNSDQDDYEPSNLFWVIPEGGVDAPEKPGFKVIPDYSRHCVSETGQVWSRKTKKFGTTRPAANGKSNVYFNTSVVSNTGFVDTAGLHRIMAMAFHPLSRAPEKLTVNHVYGLKALNGVKDVEWSTYSQNNLHAKEQGLNQTRIPVIVRDYQENKLMRFKSKSATGFYFGVGAGTVVRAIGERSVFRGRYEMREQNEDGVYNWNVGYFSSHYKDVREDLSTVVDVDETQRQVAVYKVDSKKLMFFPTYYAAAEVLRIPAVDIYKSLTRNVRQIDNGLLFCFKDEAALLIPEIKDGKLPDSKMTRRGTMFLVKRKSKDQDVVGFQGSYRDLENIDQVFFDKTKLEFLKQRFKKDSVVNFDDGEFSYTIELVKYDTLLDSESSSGA